MGIVFVLIAVSQGVTLERLREAAASRQTWASSLGLFPFIDLAFGTFYMPEGRQPQRFGIVGDDVPDGLLGQLVYPFRRGR